MGIQRVAMLDADAVVCGETRAIRWEQNYDGKLVISGVNSFDELMRILNKLGEGGIFSVENLEEKEFKKRTRERYGFEPPPDEFAAAAAKEVEDILKQEVRAAEKDVQSAGLRGEVPLATPVTQPVKAADGLPHFDVPAKVSPPLKEGSAPKATRGDSPASPTTTGSKTKVSEGSAPKAGTGAPASSGVGESSSSMATSAGAASENSQTGDDLEAFANMTKLAEVVTEVRARVGDTYEAVLAYCKKLQGIGDVCGPLDQLGERLEERLKTHLAGKGIKVPL